MVFVIFFSLNPLFFHFFVFFHIFAPKIIHFLIYQQNNKHYEKKLFSSGSDTSADSFSWM